jgi:hypothetical protein
MGEELILARSGAGQYVFNNEISEPAMICLAQDRGTIGDPSLSGATLDQKWTDALRAGQAAR